MNLPAKHTSTQRHRVQVRLLAWFDEHRRDLPWRNNRDPYRIWVSEVMLQQTTVKAVIPLFLQFLERFPTVDALAKATEQDVLHAWQGLGYYRRARWLHQAAQKIVCELDGQLPMTPDGWETLQGIGQYTRNAILSQAFDQCLPIVEANSLRVLTRLYASYYDPKSTTGITWLWATAEQLMPKKRCGDWNQALMELGALICTVKKPNCSICPVRTDCQAHKNGVVDELPIASKRVEKIQQREVGLIIQNATGVLLVQFPTTAKRWGTMWSIPTKTVEDGDNELEVASELCRELGLANPSLTPSTKTTYVVTRHRITLTMFVLQHGKKKLNLSAWQDHRWITSTTAMEYPMSTHQRRLFKVIQPTLFDKS